MSFNSYFGFNSEIKFQRTREEKHRCQVSEVSSCLDPSVLTSRFTSQRAYSSPATLRGSALNQPNWRKRLVGGQNPFVTIIGCADSRVPPELLFDQGFGDLFVIRVAGNVIDTDVAGSVEYGVDHLATKLVVVMGHEGCGAVTAALQKMADIEKEPNEIQALVGKIKPAVREFDEGVSFEERLKTSVEDNVRNSVKLLKAIPDLAKAEEESRTKVVGAVYEIKTGRVRVI